tara:strand:- start:233 stop:601 length:369 start_codon:yes stop_codon:yes gene_type:complete
VPSLNEAKAETETLIITLEDIVMDFKEMLEELVKRNIRTLDVIYTKVDRSKMKMDASKMQTQQVQQWISANDLVQNFNGLAEMNHRILDRLYPETDRAKPKLMKVCVKNQSFGFNFWIDDDR